MKEKETDRVQERNGLDEKRRNALLRYVAVLFAVAFVLVLLSLLGQMRDSKTTISRLNQSSTSALQKAENLQERNQALEQENIDLVRQLEAAESQRLRQEEAYEKLEEQLEQAADREKAAAEALEAEQALQKHVLEAYEGLTGMVTGKISADKKTAEAWKQYLGPNGLQAFEHIMTGE